MRTSCTALSSAAPGSACTRHPKKNGVLACRKVLARGGGLHKVRVVALQPPANRGGEQPHCEVAQAAPAQESRRHAQPLLCPAVWHAPHRTYTRASSAVRYGSSPNDSLRRPQRGSRAMLITGLKQLVNLRGVVQRRGSGTIGQPPGSREWVYSRGKRKRRMPTSKARRGGGAPVRHGGCRSKVRCRAAFHCSSPSGRTLEGGPASLPRCSWPSARPQWLRPLA